MTTFDNAPCVRHDPATFEPDKSDHAGIRAAKAICAPCPVKDACLKLALDNEWGNAAMRAGIFGGLSPGERAKIANGTRLPIQHGTEGGYRAHKRRLDPPCEACKQANRIAGRERDARAKERAA